MDVGPGRRARASPGREALQLSSKTGLELDGERVPPLRPKHLDVLGQSQCTICQGLK